MNIVAARARGVVTVMSGTSMAAPHVTGLVALLFQLVVRAGYTLPTFAEIRGLLFERADEQDPFVPKLLSKAVKDSNTKLDPRLGAGRVDGTEAVGFVAKLLADRKNFQRVPAGPILTLSPEIVRTFKDFRVPPQLMKELFGNGSGNLVDLMKLLVQKIEKKEPVKMWIER